MHKFERMFLSILFSFLLVFGQSVEMAMAGVKKTAVLKLQTAEVNASVIDTSKNVLVIENASKLSKVVQVKPSRKTLKNAKSVKIQGTLDGDKLNVDLSALGPANLLPSGEYTVTALAGKKKVTGKFNYNAPKLIIGKLRVPVPDVTGEKKARILRYQTTGDAEELLQEDQVEDAVVTLFDPETHEPIEGVPPISTPGTPTLVDTDGDGKPDSPVNFYQVFQEVSANIFKRGNLPPYFELGCQVQAPTATGENKGITLHALAFDENTNEQTNSISDVTVDAASDVAVKLADIVHDEVLGINSDAVLAPIQTYLATIEATHDATDAAPTIDQALVAADVGLALNSGMIYTGCIGDFSMAGIPSGDVADVATDIAWTAPELVDNSVQDINPDTLNNTPYDTEAVGYFPEELPQGVPPPPIDAEVKAYDQGIIPSSINVQDENTILDSIRSGVFPAAEINAEIISQFLENASDALAMGTVSNFDPSMVRIPVPPGILGNIDKIAEQAKNALANQAGFSLEILGTPGCVLNTTGDLPQGVTYNAAEGAFMPPALASLVGKALSGIPNFAPPPGLVPAGVGIDGMLTASFVPPNIASSLGNNFGIYSGTETTQNLSGNVFALNTGRPSETGPASFGGIATFDPAQHSSILNNTLSNLGSQAGNFFGGGSSTYFSAAFTQGAPPPLTGGGSGLLPPPLPSQLSGFANNAFGSFTSATIPLPSTGATSLGGIVSNFGGGPSSGSTGSSGGTGPSGGTGGFDFGAIFGGSSGGHSPFSSMGGSQPPVFGPPPTLGTPTAPPPTLGTPTAPPPTLGTPTAPPPTLGTPTAPPPTLGTPTAPPPTGGDFSQPPPTGGGSFIPPPGDFGGSPPPPPPPSSPPPPPPPSSPPPPPPPPPPG